MALEDDRDDLDDDDFDDDPEDLDDEDLDEPPDDDDVELRLERAAAAAPTIRADGTIVMTEAVCRSCGCSSTNGCPGGCIWAEPNLCSRCALGGVR